jgi:hypothetical protein
MHTLDTVLETIQRTQRLRAEAQHLWWQAQTARQQLTGGQRRYLQLMRKHQRVLEEIRQALSESIDGR